MNTYFNNALGMLKVALVYPIAEKAQKREISSKLSVLRFEAAQPFVERKKLAKERLIENLLHAGQTVPYYRELFAKLSFNPENLRKDVRYFEDLPFLTKDILREQRRRLISEEYAEKIVREQKTGSSTGLAATIYYDQIGLDWTAAQNILMLTWGGKRRYNREAHLSTRFATVTAEALQFETKKCFALHRSNIYTDGLGDKAQEALLKDLKNANAVVVQGHPSSLYALARYLNRRNKTAPGLFAIFISTGEMMTPLQRACIEEVFSTRVSNRYGACEFGVMAQERVDGAKGELMVSDSLVWPESVPLEGESGSELVFTNLRNKVMPLVRYKMGDLGILEERSDGWWIKELTGRVHNSVTIDGTAYPTHYIQDILDRCGSISDFQIIEREGKVIELRLVTPLDQWEAVKAAALAYFPTIPMRRIDAEELVFVGVRGKFSYIVRQEAL